jgi:putative addiction module component (TIGR02574 family)
MTVSIKEITAAALALPPEARAELADRVAASIASDISPRIKKLQMEEIQRRRSEVLSGKVQGVSSKQVRDEIASLLK